MSAEGNTSRRETDGLSDTSRTHQSYGVKRGEGEPAGEPLASFVDVCRDLNCSVGVVDVVFEVWIVDKFQLDMGRVFHVPIAIH